MTLLISSLLRFSFLRSSSIVRAASEHSCSRSASSSAGGGSSGSDTGSSLSASQFRPKDRSVDILGRGTWDIVQDKVGTIGTKESECSMLAWDNEEQVDVDCSGEETNINGYRLSLPESYPKL